MRRMWVGCAILFLIFSVVADPSSGLAEDSSSEVHQEWGVLNLTYKTPKGKVQVRLPDDMSQDDQVSGTVYLIPEGSKDKEAPRGDRKPLAYSL